MNEEAVLEPEVITYSLESSVKSKPKIEEVTGVINTFEAHERIITIAVKELKTKDYYVGAHSITVGISICNPIDDEDPELGVRIAEGRARKALEKEDNYMYVAAAVDATRPQSKNKHVLSQFAESAFYHFKHNPQHYIVNFKNK